MGRTRYCPRCLTTFADEPATCPNLGCKSPSPETSWPALLQPGDRLDRTYQILEALAGGAAGMTYRARELGDGRDLVGPELAIKVLYAQRDSGPFVRRLATEAQILQSLEHPNILECRGFVHRVGRPPYLITRYEPGGTLHAHVERVGPLSTAVASRVLLQVIDALRVAHAADIVHRDLKPANVLLRTQVDAGAVPDVRIADFGIARVQGSLGGLTRVGAFVGTPEYAAPEQFLGEPATPATDLFAAAGVLWFLLTGQQPLRITQRHDAHHTHDEILEQLPPRLPRELRATEAGLRLQDVIDGLMLPDPERRADVTTVLDALEDAAEADGAGSLPRPVPSVGTGGTVFVHDDAPETFIWSGDDADDSADANDDAPPPPEPRPTLVATPPRSASTMEGLFSFGSSAPSEPAAAPEPTDEPTDPFTTLFDADLPSDPATPTPTPPSDHPPAPRARPLPTDPMAILALLPDADRRADVLTRLSTWDPDEAATWLRQARRHPDPDTRTGALHALIALDRADLISLGRGLLRDPIASVRATAATALGALGGANQESALRRLLDDEDESVRTAA